MNSRLFKIIWAPTIGSWAILWAIYFEAFTRLQALTQPPLLIVTYMLASGYLAYRFDVSISKARSKDSITTVSQSYATLWTTVVAGLISLTGTVIQQTGNPWLVAAVAGTLVVSTVVEGLGSYSDEQLTAGFEERSKEREKALTVKEGFSQQLAILSKIFSENQEVLTETARIREIVNYSSYFRSERAAEDLSMLRDSKATNPKPVLEILRGIY